MGSPVARHGRDDTAYAVSPCWTSGSRQEQKLLNLEAGGEPDWQSSSRVCPTSSSNIPKLSPTSALGSDSKKLQAAGMENATSSPYTKNLPKRKKEKPLPPKTRNPLLAIWNRGSVMIAR